MGFLEGAATIPVSLRERRSVEVNRLYLGVDRQIANSTLAEFGRSWIRDDIAVLVAGLENAANVQPGFDVPDSLAGRLGEMQMILSATGGEVSVPVEVQIGDQVQRESSVDLTPDGVMLHVGQKRDYKGTEALEENFQQIEQDVANFRQRWTETINSVTTKDPAAMHRLLDGLFAVTRFADGQYISQDEKTALKAWLDSTYSMEDQRFLHMLRLSGLYWVQTENVITYRLQQQASISSDIVGHVINEVVGTAISDERVGLGDVRFLESEGSYAIQILGKTLALSRAGEVLANKNGLIARGAGEKGDLFGLLSHIAASTGDGEVSFNEQEGTLRIHSGNLQQSLFKLQEFFEVVSFQTGLSSRLSFGENLTIPEKERAVKLLDYSSLLSEAHDMKITHKTRALVEQQSDRGHVFYSAVGPTNSGKTTLTANTAELVLNKFPDSNLQIQTLPKGVRDVDTLADTVENVLHRMVFRGENILLVVQDAHLIFMNASQSQLNRIQSTLEMFHAIVEKLPNIGGMVLNSEQSLPRKAIGMWQRLPEVQLTLFREKDLKHNTATLREILKLHPDVFGGISDKSRERVVAYTAKLISRKKIDEIVVISPGLLLEELSTAARRLDSGKEVEKDVLAEVKSNIEAHVSEVRAEQVGDAVSQLEARMDERLQDQEKAIEALRNEVETFRAELKGITGRLSELGGQQTTAIADLTEKIQAMEAKMATLGQAGEPSARYELEARSEGHTFFGRATAPIKPQTSRFK